MSGRSVADLVLKVGFFVGALLEEVVDRVFWVGKGVFEWIVGVFEWIVGVFEWILRVFEWIVGVFEWILRVFEWILGVFEWIFEELVFGSEFIFHDFEVIFFIEVAVVEDF